MMHSYLNQGVEQYPTQWTAGLLEKLKLGQILKEFPALYETRSFVAVSIRIRRSSSSHTVTLCLMKLENFR